MQAKNILPILLGAGLYLWWKNTQSDNSQYAYSNDIFTNTIDTIENLPEIIMSGATWKINEYDLYGNTISNTEQQYGIPTDLLGRLLFQESRFRADIIDGTVKSPTGAEGIAQFEPDTAAQFGIDPLNPESAIDAAGKYLSQLHDSLGDWSLALMAYNWGIGNVHKWLAGKATEPTETKNYVAQITADVNIA